MTMGNKFNCMDVSLWSCIYKNIGLFVGEYAVVNVKNLKIIKNNMNKN